MYKSIKHIAESLDCSTKTVDRIVKEMQASGRYTKETFLLHPRRVRWESVVDFCSRGKK